MHRPVLAGTLLVAAAVVAVADDVVAVAVWVGVAAVAVLPRRGPQRPVRSWVRDDGPTGIFDRPGGRVDARPGLRTGPARIGLDTLNRVVGDDRATIRGIAGTGWTARRVATETVPGSSGR